MDERVVSRVTDGVMTAPDCERFGDVAKPCDASRFECRICWYVYDPAEGDVVWQIPAGTAFSQLPTHWTCPNCSATRDQFLVLFDDAQDAAGGT